MATHEEKTALIRQLDPKFLRYLEIHAPGMLDTLSLVTEQTNPELMDRFKGLSRKIGVGDEPALVLASRSGSFGDKNTVLLEREALTDTQMRDFILGHELVHYRGHSRRRFLSLLGGAVGAAITVPVAFVITKKTNEKEKLSGIQVGGIMLLASGSAFVLFKELADNFLRYQEEYIADAESARTSGTHDAGIKYLKSQAQKEAAAGMDPSPERPLEISHPSYKKRVEALEKDQQANKHNGHGKH